MKLVTSVSWHNGGTFITNFHAHKLITFTTAVQLYGDPNLVVSDVAVYPAPSTYGGSLHYLGGPCDLSNFWRLYEKIESGEIVLGKQRVDDPHEAYDRAMGVVGK